jgi:muconolactone D-isomerase
MEFLLKITVRLPHDMTASARAQLVAAERVRGAELTASGTIRAIWRIPGQFANYAIWSSPSATELHEAITSLPMWPYIDAHVTPLARHELSESCEGLPAGLVCD